MKTLTQMVLIYKGDDAMYFLNSIQSSIWLDKKSFTSKRMAQYRNQKMFMNFFTMLGNEALAMRYKLVGNPDTVEPRTVMESLLWHGSVGFFVKEDNILALPGVPTDGFNINRDPVAMYVYGANGFNEHVNLFIKGGDDSKLVRQSVNGTAPKEGTGVWVRENRWCYPFINFVMDFADMISDTYRTLDTVRMNIKRPYYVVAEEQIINSVKSFFNKRDANEEYIVSSGVFPADKIKLLPFENNPENLRDCTMLIEWYLSQFRQFEGIDSPMTVDKKAQISVDEFHSGSNVSELKKFTDVEYLNEQMDFVNEKLGTNMHFEKVEMEGEGDNDTDTTSERDEDTESVVS